MMSKIKKYLFNIIQNWPEYQAVPEIKILFVIKQKLRLMILYYSATLFIKKKTKSRLAKTNILKNTQKNRPVLLIASGPSADEILLKIKSIDEFKSKFDIAVVNSYYQSVHAERIIPNYYFLADPYYWHSKNKKDISFQNLLKYLKSNPAIQPVIPFLYEDIINDRENLYFNNLIYFRKRKKLSAVKANLFPSSVSLFAISFLYFLGYGPIYICGLDVSYNRSMKIDDLNNMILDLKSNYSRFNEESKLLNLAEVNFTLQGLNPFNMSQALNTESIFLRDLRHYASLGLVNVSNDTTNDALPRASLLL
jgi:hypothetical protein